MPKSSFCKGKLSGTGEFGRTNLHDELHGSLAQVFSVTGLPFHIGGKGTGCTYAVDATPKRHCPHLPVVDELHRSGDQHFLIVLRPVLCVELNRVAQRGGHRELRATRYLSEYRHRGNPGRVLIG